MAQEIIIDKGFLTGECNWHNMQAVDILYYGI